MNDKDKIYQRTCCTCGSQYTMRFNKKYRPHSGELKYINEDGKHRYFSNMPKSCCPTCMYSGKK